MEATPRIELGMELLQSSALPLGYVARKLSTDFTRWSPAARPAVPGARSRRLAGVNATDDFREAMAAVPAGVAVVSARTADGFRGLAASSFTSVSIAPPMLLVCLDSLSQTRDAVVRQGEFNLSVLERSQEFLAERFAGRAPLVDPTWEEVPHTLGRNGLPVLRDCVAWFECRVRDLHAAGDHEIAVGEVLACGRGRGEPLVLWDRSFWRLE